MTLNNRLLGLLPSSEWDRLVPQLQTVPLEPKQIIYHLRASIDYVYFPLSGVISAMAMMSDGSAIEVATIGNEGMSGQTAFNGGDTSPYEVMVQVAGEALRMKTSVFMDEVRKDGPFRSILVQYSTAFALQVSYAVACNGLHKIEPRCCRWLLMTQDRVGSNVLPLTHEFLAIMLGVRRASVTEVLQPLQERGLIRNSRGEIEILNRAGLEATACECYRVVSEEFIRLLG